LKNTYDLKQSKVAAGHAGQSDCVNCREFSKKFESNMQGLLMSGFQMPTFEENLDSGYRVIFTFH